MEAKQTVTPVCYGVSTTESSKDGFHVEITDARLNIGLVYPHGFDSRRRKCNVDELWEAVRKLNAHDRLVKALQAYVELDEFSNGKDNEDPRYRAAVAALTAAQGE